MADLYTVKLTTSAGTYTFNAAPGFAIRTTDISRRNATPNVLVARDYEWPMRCHVRADTPTASVTALQSALTGIVANRTIPTLLKLEDANGSAVTEVGDVRTGTSENWEDLRVTTFDLDDRDGQLVAGAWFTLGFAARRAFPDTNGICEFFQEWSSEADDLGREVRRLTTEIRLAKSSSNTITGTTAVSSQLKLDAPVGWTRTKGTSSLGFDYRYPLYPLTHYAICVSEVTKNNGVSAATGATSASNGIRTIADPAKGIDRLEITAETTGPDDPLAWVETWEPSESVNGETFVDLSKKRATGEWKQIQPLNTSSRGKTTKVVRTFSWSGGGREAGFVEMSPPTTPEVRLGPISGLRLTESVEVFAKGATSISDFDVPAALPAPWIAGPIRGGGPRVTEDAVFPTQRLWVWPFQREYAWDSTEDPIKDPSLMAAIFAAAKETFS